MTPDISAAKSGIEVSARDIGGPASREIELPSGDKYSPEQRIFTNASSDSDRSPKAAKPQT